MLTTPSTSPRKPLRPGSRVLVIGRHLGTCLGRDRLGWYVVQIDGETVRHHWQPVQVEVVA